MSHENLQRISELAGVLDVDTERPTDPAERVKYLEKHRSWLHTMQSLVLSEMESTYRQQLIARDELHGESNDGL